MAGGTQRPGLSVWGIIENAIWDGIGWVSSNLLPHSWGQAIMSFGSGAIEWLTSGSWLSVIGVAAFGVMLINQLKILMGRSKTLSHITSGDDDSPVHFGAPVQRSKEGPISHWSVPIKIDERKIKEPSPTKIYPCELYLDGYQDGKSKKGAEGIRLWVGDVGLGGVTERTDLAAGSLHLVPIAWRSEEGDDKNGYITDGRFFRGVKPYEYPVWPNREKQRYHLRVKSAFFNCVSPHCYFLRVPTSSSNGHFVLEMEHK
jgi:hypothetical protein